MPINPNILLQGQVADIGKAVSQGFETYNQVQAGKLNQQKLQQLELQMGLFNDARLASRIKPLISGTPTKEDLAVAKRMITESHLSPEDKDMYSLYLDANRLDRLNAIGDQTIQTARDAGVFERDYAATGAGGYTPSAITLFDRLQQLQNEANSLPPGPEQERALAKVEQFANIVRASQTYSGGGQTTLSSQPLTGTTRMLPVTPAGSTGVGAPPSPPPLTGTGAVDQSVLNQPIEGGAPAPRTPTVTTPTVEDIAAEIARRNAQLQTATTAGEKEAIRMGDYEKDIQNHRSLRRGLDAVFADEGIEGLFKDLPEGKLSSAVNNAISTFMGGTKGKDAEGRVAQLSRMIIAGVPYDPGSQSNAELQAREALVGALNDPNISANEKIKSIKRYFRFADERNQSAKETLSDFYERNPAINAPSWFRTQQLSQPRGNAAAPMTSGQPTLRYTPGQGLIRVGGQ